MIPAARSRILLLILCTLTAAACGGTDDTNADAAMDSTAAGAQGSDALPAAVLGTAPAPQGAEAAYFPADNATRGYLAVPPGAGPHPAVILVHEWDGLKDRVRQVADALAAEGYVALAADMFSGRTGNNPDENMALVRSSMEDQPRLIANLNAAAAFLRARPDVTGKIAVMGWCYGGGVALSYGIEGDPHDGTAIFYGQLVTDPARLARIGHPVYGTFAGEDQGIPVEQVNQFVEALRSAGIENDVHVYQGMQHGFWLHVDQDAARQEPAQDAWRRLRAWLASVLR